MAFAACHGGLPWPSLLHALALAFAAAWPWLRALALAACHRLGCVPWGGCMPWPWLRAMGGCCLGFRCCMRGSMPCPWLHAHGLGCVPWGAARPWPWLRALALAACLAHKFRVMFLKMRVFWKRRLFAPKRQALGMAGCPGACPHARHAASPRIVPHSGKIGSCLFPFLCS